MFYDKEHIKSVGLFLFFFIHDDKERKNGALFCQNMSLYLANHILMNSSDAISELLSVHHLIYLLSKYFFCKTSDEKY